MTRSACMRTLLLAPMTAFIASAAAFAQGPGAPAESRGPQLAPPLFAGLTWRSLGPPVFGGRILDIDVGRAPGQPDQIYILPENGGAFKSGDHGASWTPIFDHVNTMMSMGDIAVSPSNPNTIYLGTG